MGKRKFGALEKLEVDFPALQHKIRVDPESYRDEFVRHYSQYQTCLGLVRQSPSSTAVDEVEQLRELVNFIAHVADCYRDLVTQFPSDLITLLEAQHEALEAELCEKLIGSLLLLRKKDIIDPQTILNTFIPILTSTSSKSLRTLLYSKVVLEVRSANASAANHKLNRALQATLYHLLTSDRLARKGIWATRITRELWRRQVWQDTKAVEIMKEAALADDVKVATSGVNFFLGGDKEREDAAEESSDGENAIDMFKLRHQIGINKKTGKQEKRLKAAAASVKKKERKKKQPHPLNFSALHLLNDPHTFAETLLSRHLKSAKSKLKLEQKLIVLQLVSRLIGLHKLEIISFYSWFHEYLTPKQTNVTSFLASLAQGTHSRVPPDEVEPLLQKIANEFVSEAVTSQVAAAGLNAIREICARQPLAMNETLLQDLILYRKSKDKGVMMAARGLLSLYRDVAAGMLKKRDRGRAAAVDLSNGVRRQQRFGDDEGVEGIEGLELLEQWKIDERRRQRIEKGLPPDPEDGESPESEDENDWKAWDVEDDDSESSGGWIEVHSEGSEIDVSDSDDEAPASKRLKGVHGANSEQTGDRQRATNVSALKLATTRVLTPADLAKLNELRLQQSVTEKLKGRQKQAQEKLNRHIDDPLTSAEIEAPGLLGLKATKEEKIAAARQDREENHEGRTARQKRRKEEAGKSSTNREKARKKNIFMTLGKAKGKQKQSLHQRGKVLKAHVERQKRGGKRGNK